MTENESANCRMEANYSHQQELDMIPLMLTEGFKPKGWLGLILGTRMWYMYPFWGADADDDAAFERRLDSAVGEIGDRGKVMLPESVLPFREPTPEPAPAPAVARRAPAPAPAPALAPAAKKMQKHPALHQPTSWCIKTALASRRACSSHLYRCQCRP